MRTPSWETSAGALAAMFGEFGPLIKADLWTITLGDGTELLWSGADAPLQVGPRYFALGPGVKRTQIRWRVGISTDTLTMTLTDVASTLIAGKPLQAFIRSRGFRNARVKLERAFWRSSDAGPVGCLPWFFGDVDDAEGDRSEGVITVSSFTKRLEVAVPRDVYQTQCLNQLFDARCGLVASTYTVAGSVTAGTTGFRTTFGHSLVQPAEWGSLGIVTMTSGANAGQSRTCRQQTTTQIVALQPWGSPIVAGDTFTLRAGCDRLLATCTTKFNNRLRFRGQPFIPAPETVL